MRKDVLAAAVITTILCAGYFLYRAYHTPAAIPLEFIGGEKYDSIRAHDAAPDGGYILAGMTTSYGVGHVDVYAAKLDRAGRMQWDTTFGGKMDDRGHALAVNADGSFAIGGITTSYGAGAYDALLVKADSRGNRIFIKSYGWDKDENIDAMCKAGDGYLLAGSTNHEGRPGEFQQDLLLIKTDADGNCLWARAYGGKGADRAHAVTALSNGGFAVAGSTNSFGAGMQDAYVIITDADGNCVNSMTYGYKSSDRANGIAELKHGGLLIAAEAGSFEGSGSGASDIFLIKTAENLLVDWFTITGGLSIDYAQSCAETPDGGFLAACVTASEGNGETDVKIIKFDTGNRPEWEKLFGGSYDEYVGRVLADKGRSFTLSGWAKSFGNGDYDGYFTKIKY